MSSERIIQVADLSLILGSLRSLQSDIGTVSNQVDNVGHGFNWAVEFAEVFLPREEDRGLLGELMVREDDTRPALGATA